MVHRSMCLDIPINTFIFPTIILMGLDFKQIFITVSELWGLFRVRSKRSHKKESSDSQNEKCMIFYPRLFIISSCPIKCNKYFKHFQVLFDDKQNLLLKCSYE